MTVITHARRKPRLAKLIESAGGMSVGTALAQARANLDRMRPRSMAEIEACVARLADLPEPVPEARRTAMLSAYSAANGVIDAAGPFNLPDLCGVALGLCDLIDGSTDERPLDWRVVAVHAQTLRLLLTLPEDARAERDAILAELNELVAKKRARADQA